MWKAFRPFKALQPFFQARMYNGAGSGLLKPMGAATLPAVKKYMRPFVIPPYMQPGELRDFTSGESAVG
jgi:hypothetical protein